VQLYVIYRIIGIIVCGIIAYFTYHLDKKAIKKGNYHLGLYGSKTTIWGFLFYFSFIFLMIFICSFFGWLD